MTTAETAACVCGSPVVIAKELFEALQSCDCKPHKIVIVLVLARAIVIVLALVLAIVIVLVIVIVLALMIVTVVVTVTVKVVVIVTVIIIDIVVVMCRVSFHVCFTRDHFACVLHCIASCSNSGSSLEHCILFSPTHHSLCSHCTRRLSWCSHSTRLGGHTWQHSTPRPTRFGFGSVGLLTRTSSSTPRRKDCIALLVFCSCDGSY